MGRGRPLVPAADRGRILAALRAVDYVTYFPEETPLRLIRLLRPDVLVKGGDYRPEAIVGAKEVRERGGEVRVVPLIRGRSTTLLARRIRLALKPRERPA
jgi:D-beta-D-heptose 7-phosphate kinase/D-beta-D-heptose 1-phosphate adenosyltransferase